MTQHTPGPFCAGELACGCRVLVARDDLGERRDSVYCQLHAAAPELLEALTAIEQIFDGRQPIGVPGAVMMARAAIRAATGVEP